MKEYAQKNHIPIILDEGLMFLRLFCETLRPKNILEIGGAIGFSSINMAKYCDAIIDTIEINADSFNIMQNNIQTACLTERINPILENALTIDINRLKKTYDLIFIDAAKAQYIKFFEKFSPLLSPNGIIITDNLLFHDLIFETEISSKNLRNLVKKIRDFNYYLKNNFDFVTRVFNIGDGIAVSRKKK